MGKNRSFWVGIVAAAALAVMGCSDDENGGTAGNGGTGGTGGTPATGNVTAVHLAPEVPSAEDTAVALFVNGEEQTDLGTLEYSQSTGKIALPVGTYESIGVGVPGASDPVVTVGPVDLMEGDDLVVVAHRTGDESLVDLFVFDNTGDNLAATDARVNVGHGADDDTISPVNVFTVTVTGDDPPAVDECTPLFEELLLGEQTPRDDQDPQDITAGMVTLALDLGAAADCPTENVVGPVGPVDLIAGSTYVIVAVDEDTANADATDQDIQLWAIIDGADPLGLVP